MNRMLIVALAAATLAATPAMAQEAAAASMTGPRIGANIGFADDHFLGTEAFTYGVEVGYDFDAGGAVVGLTGEIQDSEDITRELALTARVGAKLGSNGLLYATAGYSNVRAYGTDFDGFRIGAGAEIGIGSTGFVKLEQRYGNYDYDVDLYQTLIGAGIRF